MNCVTLPILLFNFFDMDMLLYLSKRLLILAVLISLSRVASNAQNNVLLYGGNAFYWSDSRTDTTKEIDPETGEMLFKIVIREAAFTKMNDEKIYNSSDKETIEPAFKYNNQDENSYFKTLFKSKPEFKGISPFSIDKMVISKAGKPIYFELNFDDVVNTKALKEKWGSLIEKYVKNMPNWKPGLHKGQPVIFYSGEYIHITG